MGNPMSDAYNWLKKKYGKKPPPEKWVKSTDGIPGAYDELKKGMGRKGGTAMQDAIDELNKNDKGQGG